MENPSDPNYAALQLQRARELLAQGQHQEALVLALDALQGVLQNLRDALRNLQRNLTPGPEDQAPAAPSQNELEALEILMQGMQDKKSRIYH